MIAMVAVRNALVVEPIWKTVRVSTGSPLLLLRTPKPLAYISLLLAMIPMARPGMSNPLHPAGNVGFDIRNQFLHPGLDSRFGLGWFRRFRGIREVESKRDDDYQRRKEDHQNTAVDFRPGFLRCTLRRNW